MVAVEHSTRIRRPPGLVFRSLANRDLATSWRWDLVDSRQVSPGLPHVGAVATERARGLPWATTSQLIALQADRSLIWRSDGPSGRVEAAFTVDPDGDATRLTCRLSASPRLRLPGWQERWQRRLWSRVQADLSHLVDWLEQGIYEEPGASTGFFGRILRRFTWRYVRYDIRSAPVSDGLVSVELDRRHATCEMYCHFCPSTAAREPRDLPPPGEADQLRIHDAFARALDAAPSPEVALWSADVLRYPGLFDLLDVAADQGRRVTLHTPGLALADRAYAERFVGRDVRFDLTVHAMDHDTFTAMCGNPAAFDLIFRAIDNLHALGIPVALSTAVTDRNVHALADIIRGLAARYGTTHLNVRIFYPDGDQLSRAYQRQYPSYAAVADQLRSLAGASGLPELQIGNLPACQIDPTALEGLKVRLVENRNGLRTQRFDACPTCPARETCPGVHEAYGDRWPVLAPDMGRVQGVLDRVVQRGSEPGGGALRGSLRGSEILLREPLDPAGHAELIVEVAEADRTYWLRSGGLGAWYRVTEALPATERRRVERALDALRERLTHGEPGLEDFRAGAAAVRRRLERPSAR